MVAIECCLRLRHIASSSKLGHGAGAMGKCKVRLSGETFEEKGHRGECLAADDQAEPAPGEPHCKQQRTPDADAKETVHETGTERGTASYGYGGLRFRGAGR